MSHCQLWVFILDLQSMLQLIDLWELSHYCLCLLAQLLCEFRIDLGWHIFSQHFLHLLRYTLRLLLDVLVKSFDGFLNGLKFRESEGSTHLS